MGLCALVSVLPSHGPWPSLRTYCGFALVLRGSMENVMERKKEGERETYELVTVHVHGVDR